MPLMLSAHVPGTCIGVFRVQACTYPRHACLVDLVHMSIVIGYQVSVQRTVNKEWREEFNGFIGWQCEYLLR